MNKKFTLGLDLGTNSVGWALVDKDQRKILGMGVRIIPMGADKISYEKGAGITKNADRRAARTIRMTTKRYKLRRNKLLYILAELEMLPDQFQFKSGIPDPSKLQELELLPIGKGTLQLDSFQHYQLRERALTERVDLKELGKILYQFNQLRGYAGGGNNDEDKIKRERDEDEGPERKRAYEVITQKVEIKQVEKSDRSFKLKGGKNKGQEMPIFDVTVALKGEEKKGWTTLQGLEPGKEEELEIRIKQTKSGEIINFALPQKTNWRKQMEATEEVLKTRQLFVGQLLLRDLLNGQNGKWTRIRNRVILRARYQEEFDAIWYKQLEYHAKLKDVSEEKLKAIARYLFPGPSPTQDKLRTDAVEGGLKYIIKNQVIYYQRPLKPQRIRMCQFEKQERVLATSHPLFQEFRCWDQINRLYVTSKVEVDDDKKKKKVYNYQNRYLTNEQKREIYSKLQNQKQVGYAEIVKIVGLKGDSVEFLNGLHVKAKLKGSDTAIGVKNEFKNVLGAGVFEDVIEKDDALLAKIWDALFNLTGSEYDVKSSKVSVLIGIMKNIVGDEQAALLALRLAQRISFPRKYANLSGKAILRILPLMRPGPADTGEVAEDFNKTGGMMFAFASSLIYGQHTGEKVKPSITDYHDIRYVDRELRNPVVEQLCNDTMQVIKALWKQYALNPETLEIRVELARDLKNSAAERERIYKGQIDSQKQNARRKEWLEEAGIPATDENALKCKLCEQQGFLSPYSGDTLEIPKFEEYQIDHIVPKSRVFDDSIANKVLVEGFLNSEKGNRTAWEYVTQQTTRYKILSVEEYLAQVNEHFVGRKKKNLLLEKIPADFVERQIKETQFISVAMKNELAKIVGSDNVKTTTGEVTAFLRGRWGLRKMLMKITEPRFRQMELRDGVQKLVKDYYDEAGRRDVYEIEHWSKRYDHRHHAVDALVVALTEQRYIQRLNNLNKELEDWLAKNQGEVGLEVKENETVLEAFFDLDERRRGEIQERVEGFRAIESPFPDLVAQTMGHLQTMIVSFKAKDNLTIRKNEKSGKKELKIRSALHEATFYGKHNGQDTKTVSISELTAKQVAKVVDPILRREIDAHRTQKGFGSMKEAFSGEGLKTFIEGRLDKRGNKRPPVYKVKVYYNTKDKKENSLQRLYDWNERLSVKTGNNYLFLVMEKNKKGITERVFDIVPLFDAAQIARDELKFGNDDFRRSLFEYYVKKNKAERLLFTLRQNELVYLPENADDPLLSMKAEEEFRHWLALRSNRQRLAERTYTVVKFTDRNCFFRPHNYADVITVGRNLTEEQMRQLEARYGDRKIPRTELNFEEFGTYGNSTLTEVNTNFVKMLKGEQLAAEPLKIQNYCIKLESDWLGNARLSGHQGKV